MTDVIVADSIDRDCVSDDHTNSNKIAIISANFEKHLSGAAKPEVHVNHNLHSTSDESLKSISLLDIPECEIKQFVICFMKELGRPEDAASILKALVLDNWIQDYETLEKCTPTDWNQFNLPKHLILLLQKQLEKVTYQKSIKNSNKFQCGSKNSVAITVHQFCVQNSIDKNIENTMHERLIEDHWFDSVEALAELTKEQYNLLLLPKSVSDQFYEFIKIQEKKTSISELFYKINEKIQRPQEQIDSVLNYLYQNHIKNIDQFKALSSEQWLEFKLPLNLYKAARDELAIQDSDNWSNLNLNKPSTLSEVRIIRTYEEYEAQLINAESLIRKVGHRLHKTSSEIDAIIHRYIKVTKKFIFRVVYENWLSTIPALCKLKSDDWQELAIPKRFVNELKNAIQNGVDLELNFVQTVPPDPRLFSSSLSVAIDQLEKEVPMNDLPKTISSFTRLFETLLCQPQNPNKRVIRKHNTIFEQRALPYKSAKVLLEAVGYIELPDVYLLPIIYMTLITEAHAKFAKLAKIYEEKIRRLSKAYNQNPFSVFSLTKSK